MQTEVWAKRLKQRLGSPVVKLATPDETIDDILKQAIERVLPYLRDAEYLSAQGPSVDLSAHKPLAILNVYASKGILPATAFGSIDEFALINYASFAGMRETISQISIRNLFRSELEVLVPRDYKLIDDVLYISGHLGQVVIEMITPQSAEKMPEQYKNWIFDYSLALVKQIEGEIRSKIRMDGAPIELNGHELKQQGLQEAEQLIAKLGQELSAFVVSR